MEHSQSDEDRIRRHAYQIYVERGCQPGHEIDDWLQAEEYVRQTLSEEEIKRLLDKTKSPETDNIVLH